jgi:hypothetical protein
MLPVLTVSIHLLQVQPMYGISVLHPPLVVSDVGYDVANLLKELKTWYQISSSGLFRCWFQK